MPMDRDYLRMMKEPTEESFWQTFAREFMDTGAPGPDGRYPVQKGIPFPYHTLGPLRWDALTTHDNVEKLRQLLDAQTNPDAATHALRMLLWRGFRSNPPMRCLRECVYVHGARGALRFAAKAAVGGTVDVHGDEREYTTLPNAPGVVESLRAWRVAYLWRKVRAFSRLRHQLINLYERVCTPERVDFAADLAAATDGLYAT